MAEPQIQYCTTSDGVSIAYCVQGGGHPIVFASSVYGSHLHLSGQAFPELIESLTERYTVVRYDGRGCGLSDRAAQDYGIEARVRDLEAVADQLGLERFALRGNHHGGAPAIAYAARHPDRISHLLLVNAYLSGRDWYNASPQLRAIGLLRDEADEQWEFVSRTIAAASGFAPELVEPMAAMIRASMDAPAYYRFRDAVLETDVSPFLPHVTAPTIVMAQQGSLTQRLTQEIAARIRGARFVVLSAIGSDAEKRLLDQFVLGVEQTSVPDTPSDRATGALRTIVFTDVEQNTALLQRLGDTRWRELLREHERLTREQLAAHGGAEIKSMGDGFMASFGSATRALDCAIALQRSFAAWNTQPAQQAAPLLVRVGVNAGEPIAEDDDLFGTAVTMAARIMAQANGGEILVSDVVRQLVAGKHFLFTDRGDAVLRGFDDPVRLYELRVPEGAPPTP